MPELNIDPSMSVDQLMGIGNIPYTPSKAPDKVSEADLEGVLRKRLYETASYDPQQDPQYRAGTAIQDKFTADRLKRDTAGMASADEQRNFMAQNKPEAPPMQSEAPKYAETAKSVSPYLLIATQLFGKGMGASAHAMLGALKGQLDGVTQNNKDAFERATDEWQKHWNTLKTNWESKQKAYNQALEWFGGRMDAEMKAAQFAEDAAGAGGEMAGNALQRHQASKEVMSALEAYHKTLLGHADRTRASNDRDYNKMQQGNYGQYTGAVQFRDTAEALYQSWQKVKALIERDTDLKKKLDDRSLTGSDLVGRSNIVNSPELADFQVKAGNEFASQFRNNIAGIPGSSLRLKSTVDAEMKNMPDLKNGFYQIDKSVENARQLGLDAVDFTRNQFESAERRHATGGPMYALPEPKEQKLEEPPKSKGTVTAATVKDYATEHNITEEKAKKTLTDLGYEVQ
jgi:hypothetical protein